MVGVVPLLIFLHETSINTFLDLAHRFLQPVPEERGRDDVSLVSLKFRFQFQVHLEQFFTGQGRRQGAEHLLIG